ncbi:unnamed protein product [Moneuplotes crassus]|uniref:Uncharacterized protein n=1 Tax=Euplotes crassus TaxID=5936 RepID=A0AAD1UNZ1_EUPCR|nr:unnamed protein product [Moneuplotes crassus]
MYKSNNTQSLESKSSNRLKKRLRFKDNYLKRNSSVGTSHHTRHPSHDYQNIPRPHLLTNTQSHILPTMPKPSSKTGAKYRAEASPGVPPGARVQSKQHITRQPNASLVKTSHSYCEAPNGKFKAKSYAKNQHLPENSQLDVLESKMHSLRPGEYKGPKTQYHRHRNTIGMTNVGKSVGHREKDCKNTTSLKARQASTIENRAHKHKFTFLEFISSNYENEYSDAQHKYELSKHLDSEFNEHEQVISLKGCFQKFIERTHGINSINLAQFKAVKFPQKYPNLIYDVVFSLGGKIDRFCEAERMPEDYKRWIARQCKGLPLETDPINLKKREDRSWLYYEDKKKVKINEILKKVGVQRIDLTQFFKAVDKSKLK